MSIECFYDVVSPYSYLAFTTLVRYKNQRNLSVKFKPFYLGGVMAASGNAPPGFLPARGKYMLKDLQRNQNYFEIGKFSIPKSFPPNTLLPQRLLSIFASQGNDELQILVAFKFWEYCFKLGKDISKLEIVKEVLLECGFSVQKVDELVVELNSDHIKKYLQDSTSEAVKRGAFGAPTMFIKSNGKEEMFFGSDRFHLLFPLIGVEWEGPNPKNSKL